VLNTVKYLDQELEVANFWAGRPYEARIHVINDHFRVVERTGYVEANGEIDELAIAKAKKLARTY